MRHDYNSTNLKLVLLFLGLWFAFWLAIGTALQRFEDGSVTVDLFGSRFVSFCVPFSPCSD